MFEYEMRIFVAIFYIIYSLSVNEYFTYRDFSTGKHYTGAFLYQHGKLMTDPTDKHSKIQKQNGGRRGTSLSGYSGIVDSEIYLCPKPSCLSTLLT